MMDSPKENKPKDSKKKTVRGKLVYSESPTGKIIRKIRVRSRVTDSQEETGQVQNDDLKQKEDKDQDLSISKAQ